ncbi:MAG: carbamoyltransferase HypF [Candidatus Cloacimonetes bacterium]|nr:carbamoyltransferase HypF [Candidatus Cloacimonadota bacterium]
MYQIKINGIVQGVGFRPFIYKLATEQKLTGFVLNSTSGVLIEAEGNKNSLDKFIYRIKNELPPAAKINEFQFEEFPDKRYDTFEIRMSSRSKGSTLISPDLAVCDDCINEFNDHDDLRFQYAFINCTNCGPRYSIIEDTPYDRPVTSMKSFVMCDYCEGEYKDPLNRRFHAQPVACPQCGPQLQFLDKDLSPILGNPIENTIRDLKDGKIIGIKGIGGFHIACDATNYNAVELLRQRKNRPHKPFAVMCNEANISDIVIINYEHLKLLKSPAAPIVILPKRSNSEGLNREIKIAENVAPQNPNIGIFLPYAPHHYQFVTEELPFVIMTSGNNSNEPIARTENELQELCDCFLTHNRPILNRSDDSIILPAKEQNILIRRSRGFVPSPIKLPSQTVPTLGCGAELKLTFSLSRKNDLFISPYIGNSGSKETMDFYLETYEKYLKWFKLKPELIACDLQPDFATTRFAENTKLPLVKVQHHHAHISAIMAEHKLDEKVIGISYDGTGYGTDAAIWGGEIFIADHTNFERLFHLNYMPLPGGDAAITHPIRIAYAYSIAAGANTELVNGISELERNVIQKQLQNSFNVFQTSSMGRLFDCISAMLGLFPTITFEAQSAMALEFLCGNVSVSDSEPYSFEISEDIIDIRPIIIEVSKDIQKGVDHKVISQKFHKTIIDFTLASVQKTSVVSGLNKVVLSGGVMQNRILLNGLIETLTRNNFTVYTPRNLSPNDGSISVGQVMIANRIIGS